MKPTITLLYTNIGRGHPFYLDGIRNQLRAKAGEEFDCQVTDVFAESSGTALTAWKTARWLYHEGSSGGMIGRLYERLRSGQSYNQPSSSLNMMVADLRKSGHIMNSPVAVAHPSLVGGLRGHPDIYYQHGELVVPDEAIAAGAKVVFVPTSEAAEPFVRSGYQPEQIMVTGLCIESALISPATEQYQLRRQRLASPQPLTGLFLSSGAEPKTHIEKIMRCLKSLQQVRQPAVVLAKAGGSLHRRTSSSKAEVHTYESRDELEKITAKVFPRLDYFVSPAHERTNWAVGLGLPIFALTPTIGPFAGMNLKLIETKQVGAALSEAEADDFAESLKSARNSGRLAQWSENGWGNYPINGFQTITKFLIDRLRR